MRLILPIPEGCPRRELDEDTSLVVLEGPEDRPVCTLTLLHPRVVPMSLLEWASDITRADLPKGASVEVVTSRVDLNQIGWTMQVVHSLVVVPPAAAPSEVRLTAIFRFTPFRTFPAAAIARIHEPAREGELRPRVAALFETAHPDWTGPEVAALAQLYD